MVGDTGWRRRVRPCWSWQSRFFLCDVAGVVCSTKPARARRRSPPAPVDHPSSAGLVPFSSSPLPLPLPASAQRRPRPQSCLQPQSARARNTRASLSLDAARRRILPGSSAHTTAWRNPRCATSTTAAMSSLKVSTAKLSAPSPTPSHASSSGSKRKRPEDELGVVYSQPQETGTGSHVLTQFTYTIEHLRDRQREKKEWQTLNQIVEFLSLQNKPDVVRQLVSLYRSPNPTNRIEYSREKDMYRYKPKYDIRDAAQLKGYLQNQKSAAGLSVKELKDGWSDAPGSIAQLEKKKEVLVTHHKKDNAVKTVWINDPSLMHPMDDEFRSAWHTIQLPANSDDLRSKLLAAGLKPSSAPRKVENNKPKEKRKKAPRRGGKQTNTHMQSILKDFSHLRK